MTESDKECLHPSDIAQDLIVALASTEVADRRYTPAGTSGSGDSVAVTFQVTTPSRDHVVEIEVHPPSTAA